MNVTIDGIIYQLQPRGGISRLYSELLPRLCDLDPALRIDLLSSETYQQPLPSHAQITPHVIPGGGGSRLRRQLAIGLGRGKIWHSTYYTRPRFWQGGQVVTVLDMIHELYPDLFPQPEEEAFRALKRRCVMDADIIISISEVTRQDLHRLYGIALKKIVAIPLAHSRVFTSLPCTLSVSLPTARPFFLYVGRRSHNKNFAGLLRAYAAWPHHSEADLRVVGGGWTEEEQDSLASLGISEAVHLVENVNDEELSGLYRRAAAYVCPSLYEGFGIPLLEAMACGCPVIASRIPATVEVAGDHPIYFDLDHPESFVDALETALNEGRGTSRCIDAERHARRYSWDLTAEQTLAVYRKLIV